MTSPASDTLQGLRYAREDLLTAERLFADADTPPRNTCLLAQQAAEKALKAVLVYLGGEVPRTHDLERLSNLIPTDWGAREWASRLGELSIWATFPRYPGDAPEADLDDSEEAVRLARDVILTVVEDFRSRGLTP